MPLTDAKLRSLKPSEKQQKIADGGGLHVLVTRGGSRLWRLAYLHHAHLGSHLVYSRPRVEQAPYAAAN